jgi:hypothetical protein
MPREGKKAATSPDIRKIILKMAVYSNASFITADVKKIVNKAKLKSLITKYLSLNFFVNNSTRLQFIKLNKVPHNILPLL